MSHLQPYIVSLIVGHVISMNAWPAGIVALKGFGLDPPFPRLLQAILMLWGMPRAVKRLMQRTATAASVCWRSKLRERRLGPISVL
jgi:hypothetical protein